MAENDIKKEYLGNGVGIFVNRDYTFGTDAVLLSDFSRKKKRENFCDLGTGCGIIPMLFYRDGLCESNCLAVEIQRDACLLFEKTLRENEIEDKIHILNCDLKNYKENLPGASFDLVTSNPPYFSKNTGYERAGEKEKIARYEIKSDIYSVAECAAYLLKYSGRFCVCHRSERLCDVLDAMRKNGIEPKRLRHVMNRENSAPYLVLAEGRKGGKNSLVTEPPLILYDASGNPTAEYKRIYRYFSEGESNE